jgi:acetylornithine aminotransferase
MENVKLRSEQLCQGLRAKFADIPEFVEVRNKGLMIGCQFNADIAPLAKLALDNQLLINVNGGGKVIRLLPALNISESEVEQLIESLSNIVHTLFASK